MASSFQFQQVPCLSDNYGYLVHDLATGRTAAIDTPEVGPLEAALAARGWRLTDILNTHHHADHAGGNLALKERWGCRIWGPRGEAALIPGMDVAMVEGDRVALGETVATVLDVPGHTRGHIAWVFDGVAFVGDTIFSMGCGRLFEGTAAQMWSSLQKLAALPDDTLLACAHEYTAANGRFARTIEPESPALLARLAEVDALRARGAPTVPTTVAMERATNPFLRPAEPAVRATLGVGPEVEDVTVYAELRRRKDHF